jgi:DNA-binding LacI/PurR family transcriptional regulator
MDRLPPCLRLPPSDYGATKNVLNKTASCYRELAEKATTWQPLAGYQAARRLLERRPDITAIFNCNDSLAYGVLKVLAEAGKKVPQDISIIGFDSNPFGEFISPKLTTMRQDAAHIGRTADKLLLKN